MKIDLVDRLKERLHTWDGVIEPPNNKRFMSGDMNKSNVITPNQLISDAALNLPHNARNQQNRFHTPTTRHYRSHTIILEPARELKLGDSLIPKKSSKPRELFDIQPIVSMPREYEEEKTKFMQLFDIHKAIAKKMNSLETKINSEFKTNTQNMQQITDSVNIISNAYQSIPSSQLEEIKDKTTKMEKQKVHFIEIMKEMYSKCHFEMEKMMFKLDAMKNIKNESIVELADTETEGAETFRSFEGLEDIEVESVETSVENSMRINQIALDNIYIEEKHSELHTDRSSGMDMKCKSVYIQTEEKMTPYIQEDNESFSSLPQDKSIETFTETDSEEEEELAEDDDEELLLAFKELKKNISDERNKLNGRVKYYESRGFNTNDAKNRSNSELKVYKRTSIMEFASLKGSLSKSSFRGKLLTPSLPTSPNVESFTQDMQLIGNTTFPGIKTAFDSKETYNQLQYNYSEFSSEMKEFSNQELKVFFLYIKKEIEEKDQRISFMETELKEKKDTNPTGISTPTHNEPLKIQPELVSITMNNQGIQTEREEGGVEIINSNLELRPLSGINTYQKFKQAKKNRKLGSTEIINQMNNVERGELLLSLTKKYELKKEVVERLLDKDNIQNFVNLLSMVNVAINSIIAGSKDSTSPQIPKFDDSEDVDKLIELLVENIEVNHRKYENLLFDILEAADVRTIQTYIQDSQLLSSTLTAQVYIYIYIIIII